MRFFPDFGTTHSLLDVVNNPRIITLMSLGIRAGFPVAGDGYQADVRIKDQHLRLFAEVYSLGYLAVVFDVNRKQRVSREDADNLDDAKTKAESLAAGYLRYRGAGELPSVTWVLNPQSKAAIGGS